MKELSPDQRRALTLVGRHDGGFGRTRLALVLAGEPDRYGPELRREALRGTVPSMRRALAALDALCELGLIEVDPSRGRHLVLRLTSAGARRLGRVLPSRPPVRRLDAAAQARFDRLVARRDLLARRQDALPSSLARLAELRETARAGARSRVELQRLLSPATFSRFGEAAFAVLAQAP